MFVPSKSKSVLGCLTTEPVSNDAVNRNRKLEDTHYRSINLAGANWTLRNNSILRNNLILRNNSIWQKT